MNYIGKVRIDEDNLLRLYLTLNKFKHDNDKRQFGNYLRKLMILGKIDNDDFDMALGRYHNIPMCCIKNFITLSLIGICKVADVMDAVYGPDDYNYVRCLKCRIGCKDKT